VRGADEGLPLTLRERWPTYGFGASISKTSLRILARTFGSQPRAAHLSSSTWAAIAKLVGPENDS
jgi:hypothetical protein